MCDPDPVLTRPEVRIGIARADEIDSASQAAADLIRFNTRIGRSVDQVININRWTLKVIGELFQYTQALMKHRANNNSADSVAEKDRNKGVVSRFMENATPFGHGQVTEQALFDQFIRHTSAIEDQIVSLIEEAQALLGILQNLDDRLEVIHGLAARDGFLVGVSRDELFAQLWTKLGGNRKSKKKVDAQLALLNHVGSYRRAAFERISHTILTLSAIHNGLEDLREQVAAPEVLANSGTNLDLHIQQIQSAVERLDERRRTSRRLEADEQRRTLDKPEQLALPA